MFPIRPNDNVNRPIGRIIRPIEDLIRPIDYLIRPIGMVFRFDRLSFSSGRLNTPFDRMEDLIDQNLFSALNMWYSSVTYRFKQSNSNVYSNLKCFQFQHESEGYNSFIDRYSYHIVYLG